ncbi:bacterial type II secretion system protein N [mine drainage metagenome]|uniref:Bacterial type II secretion system protein N n=1 Tax=mine drainage metagenome TaxID=410659 RepID=A0A1J5T7B2_9ZZZZ
MTLRRVLWALVFGSVFIVGLVVFAPAALMGYALERMSDGTLSLAQTTGSLWQGSGVSLLRTNARYQTLGSFRWNLKFPGTTLQVQTGESAPMTLHYTPFSGRIDIDNLHLALPVSSIELAAPQLGPYQLQGMLEMTADHLALNAAGMDGQVTVDWTRAASALSDIRPLGDYRIVLKGRGTGLDAQLSTLSGKLLLAATGSFDKVNGMLLNGTAQAAPGEAAEQLHELLHHLGPEVSPGVFKLALMQQSAAAR